MRNGLFDLTGKAAAVIGAGSGIGEAVAMGLAAHGAHVACLDIKDDAVSRVAGAIDTQGGSAESARLDVTDRAAVERTFDTLHAHRGSVRQVPRQVVEVPPCHLRRQALL